ncbi:MAG: hypothetical protein HKN47_23895 [Pirellulaceae bacterium]|nr:hypothetical protein [Pirellulaceae bacterium]
MNECDNGVAKRTFPRLRYSLRTLLVLFLLGSLLFRMGFVWHSRSLEQRRIVQQLITSGGWVKYEFEVDGFKEPRGPAWLRKRLGMDHFNRVARASVPADFLSLRALPDLEEVELVGGLVLDGQMTLLDDLKRLEALSIRGTRMTENGLLHLTKHRDLARLDLGSTKLSRVPLGCLAELPELHDLGLSYTDVDDTMLSQLIPQLRLTRLSLSGCDVSGKPMVAIGMQSDLVDLNLAFSDVQDSDLQHLKNLTALRRLNLAGTEIGDAGFVNLLEKIQLRELNLSQTLVGDAGFQSAKYQLITVRVLDVADSQLTDGSIDGLCELTSLEHLNMAGTLTMPGQMELFSRMPSTTRVQGQYEIRQGAN